MSYLINITGCISLNDYQTAAVHMRRAYNELAQDHFEDLIHTLSGRYSDLFLREEFKEYKSGIKTLSDWHNELQRAAERGDCEEARRIYYTYLREKGIWDDKQFEDYLHSHQVKSRITRLESNIKSQLSEQEKELALDTFTYFEHIDKPFSKRVQTEKGNFYITTEYHPDLSIIRGKQPGSARHMHWNHSLARDVLSVELGHRGIYGLVSLIGSYKPTEKDLTDISYVTASGRHYFPSALEALTDTQSDTVGKIDTDNFMVMKEVIPTASQIKAIYADGNYIIDGPAGTGKSTTLLQKLLVLTQTNGVKPSSILVLVKHDALVAPFKALLESMRINGITINSVDSFLGTHFDADFRKLSFALLDEAQLAATQLTAGIRALFDTASPVPDDLENLPKDLINTSVLHQEYASYCALKKDVISKENQKHLRENDIAQRVEQAFDKNGKLQAIKEKEHSIELKFDYTKGLQMDQGVGNEFKKITDAYKAINGVLLTAEEEEKASLLQILKSYEDKFYDLAARRSAQLPPLNTQVNIRDHINKRAERKVEEQEKSLDDMLVIEKKVALGKDDLLTWLTSNLKAIYSKLEISQKRLTSLFWGEALTTHSHTQKKMIELQAGINNKKYSYNTIIIDEAQDVSNTFIELISIYTKQIILAGDEAQKENPEGLGHWNNLRKSSSLYQEGSLAIFKLRHNFRQVYELGNLSYNYRQLLLGNPIEDLSADYFDNQKGFCTPSMMRKEKLKHIVSDKINFIANKFTEKFPVVIVCSGFKSQVQIVGRLKLAGFNVNIDGHARSNTDVIVVTEDKIAGREFPVVIALLPNDIDPGSLYIILSRAKFDLTLLTHTDFEMDEHLSKLEQLNIVESVSQH